VVQLGHVWQLNHGFNEIKREKKRAEEERPAKEVAFEQARRDAERQALVARAAAQEAAMPSKPLQGESKASRVPPSGRS
jgi:hypothetical protein